MKQINQYINLKLKLEHSNLLNYGNSDQDIVAIERIEVVQQREVDQATTPKYGSLKQINKRLLLIDPSNA